MLDQTDKTRIKLDRAMEAVSKALMCMVGDRPKTGRAVRHLQAAIDIIHNKPIKPVKECTGCGRCVACVVAELEQQVALLTAERNDLRAALTKERQQRLEDK